MDEIKIEYSFDSTTNLFKLEFNKGTKIEINVENDVDFTEFIKVLTFNLESKKKVDLVGETFEDPKMIIVLNTIREVVKSYNAVLNDYLEEVEVVNQEMNNE